MIAYGFFLTLPIKNPCSGVGYFYQIQQGGLLYFVLHALIGMVTGKCFFAHGIKELGIERRGIVYLLSPPNQIRLLEAVV